MVWSLKRHRSLIAGRDSSPLGELFYACVSVGSCTYQVSVLSGVRICRPMMVSDVPASECHIPDPCDPEITAATMPPRSLSSRPGKGCGPPGCGGSRSVCVRRPSRQPPYSTNGTRAQAFETWAEVAGARLAAEAQITSAHTPPIVSLWSDADHVGSAADRHRLRRPFRHPRFEAPSSPISDGTS
jgi:hypothetical protein